MHASRILRACLSSVFDEMHAARSRRLLSAVDALVQGRRLTLIDLARSWIGATWVHAPLKALDRLLSNARLHGAIRPLHRALSAWLVRGPSPLLLVDWTDLERDGRWCLLRAATPVGSRTLTVYERIYPRSVMNHPRVQIEFLRELSQLLPPASVPILVTDAGFRSDWFRAVRGLGWHFLGRVRSNTQVLRHGSWQPCATLHVLASRSARDLGTCPIVKGQPLSCRLAIVARPRRGRDQCTRKGKPCQSTTAKRARKGAREPWLLATSLELSAARLVRIYAQRMQIELAFRDLKSHQYGVGFEDSLTRDAKRLSVLLLLHTLATFAAWLMERIARTDAMLIDPLTRQPHHRARYSWYRRGLAWLTRTVLPPSLDAWLSSRNPRARCERLIAAGK
jgi:hypothetical protein